MKLKSKNMKNIFVAMILSISAILELQVFIRRLSKGNVRNITLVVGMFVP